MTEKDFEVHPSGTYNMISEDSLKMLSLANLLRAAKCPDRECIDGKLIGRLAEHDARCPFCEERDAVLSEVDGELG